MRPVSLTGVVRLSLRNTVASVNRCHHYLYHIIYIFVIILIIRVESLFACVFEKFYNSHHLRCVFPVAFLKKWQLYRPCIVFKKWKTNQKLNKQKKKRRKVINHVFVNQWVERNNACFGEFGSWDEFSDLYIQIYHSFRLISVTYHIESTSNNACMRR